MTRLNLKTNDIQWSLDLSFQEQQKHRRQRQVAWYLENWSTLGQKMPQAFWFASKSRYSIAEVRLDWSSKDSVPGRVIILMILLILIEIPALGKIIGNSAAGISPLKTSYLMTGPVVGHESLSSGIIPLSPLCYSRRAAARSARTDMIYASAARTTATTTTTATATTATTTTTTTTATTATTTTTTATNT